MRTINHTKDLKILVVEDEQNLAALFKEALSGIFHTIILANDGQDGYEKFLKTNPDIVMTDIMMPNMNGLDMTIKIRDENPDIPIIILSAYSDQDKLLKAIDVGINKYFIKPFDPDEVIEYIQDLSTKLNKQKVLNLVSDFSFDNSSKSLYKNDKLVKLTKRENLFFELLVQNCNTIVSDEKIKSLLWENEDVTQERIRTFIRRLRNKTSKDLIQNITGQGYMLSINNS